MGTVLQGMPKLQVGLCPHCRDQEREATVWSVVGQPFLSCEGGHRFDDLASFNALMTERGMLGKKKQAGDPQAPAAVDRPFVIKVPPALYTALRARFGAQAESSVLGSLSVLAEPGSLIVSGNELRSLVDILGTIDSDVELVAKIQTRLEQNPASAEEPASAPGAAFEGSDMIVAVAVRVGKLEARVEALEVGKAQTLDPEVPPATNN